MCATCMHPEYIKNGKVLQFLGKNIVKEQKSLWSHAFLFLLLKLTLIPGLYVLIAQCMF